MYVFTTPTKRSYSTTNKQTKHLIIQTLDKLSKALSNQRWNRNGIEVCVDRIKEAVYSLFIET